jgi:hypothetical protein
VEVNVGLPEGHEMTLTAKVVHVLSEEEAAAEGREPGVGVEFQDLDPMMKKQLWHLVEFARWEGTQDVSRSYATALMEFIETQESIAGTGEQESLPPIPADGDDERISILKEYLSEMPGAGDEPVGESEMPAADGPPASDEPEPAMDVEVETVSGSGEELEPEPMDTPGRESETETPEERESGPETDADRGSETETRVARESVPAKSTTIKSRSGPRASAPHPAARPALKGLAEALGHSIRPSGRPEKKARKPDVKRAVKATQKLAASLGSRTKGGSPPARSSMSPDAIAAQQAMKDGLKHVAYKRYDLAVKALKSAVDADPENRDARIWYHTANGRRLARDGDRKAAARAYRSVLEVDEGNQEALKFVRAFHKEEKMKNVPFARYFIKKT